MELWSTSLSSVLAILTSIIFIFITYFLWSFNYWQRRNVPVVPPKIPFGNMTGKEAPAISIKTLYDNFKSRNLKYGGIYMFSKPVYMPVDLEHIKAILATDFQYFVDRGLYYNEKADILSANLFFFGGDKWRNLRKKLTPTFTSGKMKLMLDTVTNCAIPMEKYIKQLTDDFKPIDIKNVLTNFTIDVIGTCAFGIECNSFKDPNSEIKKYALQIVKPSTLQTLRIGFLMSFPRFSRALGLRRFDKKLETFFSSLFRKTFDYRTVNEVHRNDFMQLLSDLYHNKNEQHGTSEALTMDELIAQAVLMLFAGFETSSSTVTFCLYILSTNLDVQEKVRDEIKKVLNDHNGKITYDALMEMTYMQQIIDETMRIYPSVPTITRRCVKDYPVPGTTVTISKGTLVVIPIHALHHDEEYFPNSDRFDPERFSSKAKHHPFSHIPFGGGHRICIGLRFAIMQIKVALTVLLANYLFTLNAKTKTPLEMNCSVITSAKGGIWLNAKKVNNSFCANASHDSSSA